MLYKALNQKRKAIEKFLSLATVKSNKHMAQCQYAVLSWAMLPVSAEEVLLEAQKGKDHLHLELLLYLPPWSCTQLPLRRCCCWQQQTPLPHTLSRDCKREDRDTMWTPPNARVELSRITMILSLPHSQLPAFQRKTVPWQTVECCTWMS